MNQERLMWQGQRAEAENRRRGLQTEIAGTVRQLRMDLNPMVGPLELETADILRAATRLAEMQDELRGIEERIARLDELIGG
jgi:hypothetical protein